MRNARHLRRALAIILAAFAYGAAVPGTRAALVVMHGPADETSATLWLQSDTDGPVTVAWRTARESAQRSLRLEARAQRDHVVVARLTGLAPGESVAYEVESGGERRTGTVRTAPAWTTPVGAADIAIAVGSCFFLAAEGATGRDADYGGGWQVFDAIAAAKPDVMLWLGDNVYLQPPDFRDPGAMGERYRRQRAFGPLQRLLTATTQLAIWDDHDYGPNDSDKTYRLKHRSLELFRRYWPNPQSGLPDVAGTFGEARWGDVRLFLLDDRWYRSPNREPDGPGKTMYGARQLEWLKAALAAAPREAIKIVAGGSQFWNRLSRFEGWQHFATERDAFADWLTREAIDGVIFVSGDRHFGELLKIERPGTYPLYEFTSSPLTSRPPRRIDRADGENPDVVPETLVAQRQFGIIRVTGPGEDRRIAFEARDSDGAILWQREIPASGLRHR
jgi:alkaline phosphatase D